MCQSDGPALSGGAAYRPSRRRRRPEGLPLQATIIAILMDKLEKAADATGIATVAIGGGVSANSGVRGAVAAMCERRGIRAFIPERRFTTDNAAMVAIAGYFKYQDRDFCPYNAVPYARVEV